MKFSKLQRMSVLSAACAAVLVVGHGSSALAAPILGPSTWTNTAGTASQAWTNGANWDTNPDHPSGIGAVAIINNGANNRSYSFTPTGTSGDPVPPGQPAVTFGSLTVNNTTAFTNTFTSGTSSVTLDAVGAGPAQINLLGAASSGGVPTTLGALWVFTDSVTLTVDKTTSGSTVADVNVTGPISGPGGLTKAGLGTAVITNGSGTTKTYTGATSVQAGRLRIGTQSGSLGAPLLNTSSVTVDTDAQLDLGPNAATHLFGTSSATPININGIGILPGTPIGGSFGASGAVRANVNSTLTNDIVVQSNDGSVTASGSATVLKLDGIISGSSSNRFRVNPFGNATSQGTVQVTNANTYAGGTLISQGVLRVSGANATLGTGDVFVDGASDVLVPGFLASTAGLASGQLTIDADVLNAIDDAATLTLTGDTATFNGSPDTAVGGIANLLYDSFNTTFTDVIGGLVLGGVPQTAPGEYGSSSSGATFVFDQFFTGPGTVTLAPIPEPTSLAVLGLVGAGLIARRRRRN